MTRDERKKLSDILLKLTPLAVAYGTGKVMKAGPMTPVEIPMQMIEEAADGMRDLKVMLFGVDKEAASL